MPFSVYSVCKNLKVAHHPGLLPMQVELRFHYIILVGLFSAVYVFLFEAQRAYSYQRFTSLKSEYFVVVPDV